jgi:hypothetical protein
VNQKVRAIERRSGIRESSDVFTTPQQPREKDFKGQTSKGRGKEILIHRVE